MAAASAGAAADGSALEGLSIALYLVAVSSTLVLLGMGRQGKLLPRQQPLPQSDITRLRRLSIAVFSLGLATLVLCGFVGGSTRTTGFIVLATISLLLWIYEAALFWRGPPTPS